MKTITLIAFLLTHPYVKTLDWSSFKGPVDNNPSILAKTYWEINLTTEESDGKVIYTVTPIFDEQKSFTRTSDPKILVHETMHWYLCVIYSRLIESALIPYQNQSALKQGRAERIYNSYCEKLRKMEDLYDRETKNGNNPVTQAAWERAIQKDLQSKL